MIADKLEHTIGERETVYGGITSGYLQSGC